MKHLVAGAVALAKGVNELVQHLLEGDGEADQPNQPERDPARVHLGARTEVEDRAVVADGVRVA